MKKLNIILICLFVLFSATPIYASNDVADENPLTIYETEEQPMPSANLFGLNSVSQQISMSTWKNSTKQYLENFHGQKVKNVTEDDEKVTFVFETEYMCPTEQVEEVVYYKNNSSTRASYGDVKITTYSNWSNGAVPVDVDFKTASNLAAAASVTISLTKFGAQKMSAFVSAVASYVGWTIDTSLPIQAESRAAVKYTRKIGSFYLSTNTWYPSVQIGKVQYWYYRTAYQPTYSGGPYIPHHYDNVPNAEEDDFNAQYVKNHYHYNDWITNKVLELGDSGQTYIDVYG